MAKSVLHEERLTAFDDKHWRNYTANLELSIIFRHGVKLSTFQNHDNFSFSFAPRKMMYSGTGT